LMELVSNISLDRHRKLETAMLMGEQIDKECDLQLNIARDMMDAFGELVL